MKSMYQNICGNMSDVFQGGVSLWKSMSGETVFSYLLIANVFLGGFVLFRRPFEFYLGYLFILLFLFMYLGAWRSLVVNATFICVFAIVIMLTLFNVFQHNTTLIYMAKQVFGILLTAVAYYLLIKMQEYDTKPLFQLYLKLAVCVAAIGLFQQISYIVGFQPGYDYRSVIPKWNYTPAHFGLLRVNSILPEPSHYAIAFAPAFYVALTRVLKGSNDFLSKRCAWTVLVAYLLTFSTVALVAVLVDLFLIYWNAKRLRQMFFGGIVALGLIAGSYLCIPEIRVRVDDTFGVITGTSDLGGVNTSTFVLVSNAYVAYDSFCDNPLFGRGLGSHPISFERFSQSVFGEKIFTEGSVMLNMKDANSLFLRLLSETGLFGLTLTLLFLFKCRLPVNHEVSLNVINNAIYALFWISLLRQGHYFYNGLFFFVWMYYFSYKQANRLGCQA